MNLELVQAQLEVLIQYVWEDEEANWEEAGRPDNHIFITIRALNDYLAELTEKGQPSGKGMRVVVGT